MASIVKFYQYQVSSIKGETLRLMLTLLGQRNFALLWIGQLFSVIGFWLLFISLPYYIYDLTGSALATSTTFVVIGVPGLLLGPIAGVFVDRLNRKWVMLTSDLLRFALILLLLLVRSADMVWLVYVVGFLEASAAQFFNPARTAIIPQLVGEKHLVEANALTSLGDNLAVVIGPTIGGSLYALFSFSGVTILDSLSYLVSALLIAGVSYKHLSNSTLPIPKNRQLGAIGRELLAGFKVIRDNRVIKVIMAISALIMLAVGASNASLFLFFRNILHLGVQEWSWITALQGAGSILGGLLIGQAGAKVANPRVMGVAGFIGGGLYLVMINFPALLTSLIVAPFFGIIVVGYGICEQTLLQTNLADEYRGRVSAVYGAIITLFATSGAIIAGVTLDTIGPVVVLNIVALAWLTTGALVLVLLP